MKDNLIREIEQAMLPYLDNAQMKQLQGALSRALWNKQITVADPSIADEPNDLGLMNLFLSSKKVEGCSDKTLRYYKATIEKMLTTIQIGVTHITTDNIRRYLAQYEQASSCSKANIDNIRRILSSFFSWLEDENYILKSPVRRIHKIKTTKPVKEVYTDETLEIMRDNCGMEHLHPLYKLLPAFCVLLAREMETSPDFRTLIDEFLENPAADTFVNIHEDFYQAHKMDEYQVEYVALPAIDREAYRSFSASYQVIKDNKEEMNATKEVPIIPFPAEVFNAEQRALIPHLPPEFVLPGNLSSVCSAVSSGDMLAVLFHGPAGTGKTMSCKLVAQTIGLPIMETINCTENLDEFVLGKFIPEDDRIIFKESYVTKAIRDGGAVVFEEINFAKPQHLAFLNSLLDDNGFVRLDNGEVVRRNPNFRFFATMNLGYFGTKELNQALYNRFNGVVEIAALADDAISRMLTTRVPECKPVVEKILGVYHKLKKKIESEELDVVISPRNLENWARLAKYDGYITAAEKTIIPIAKCDRVLENTIRGILMLYKWN